MTSPHPDPEHQRQTGACRVPCRVCGLPSNPNPKDSR